MSHTTIISTSDVSILASDYVPSITETLDLRTIMSGQRSTICDLNSEIATLQYRSSELHAKVGEIEGTYTFNQALLSPSRWLAPETLGEVFIHCLSHGNTVTASSDEAPLLLIRVCRRWRRVACGTPRLWQTLNLGRGFALDPLTIIPMWLRNSRALPLEFCVSLQVWRNEYSALAEREVFDLVGRSLHRCRSLEGSVSPLAIKELFGLGTWHHLPLLENLDLQLPSQCQLSNPESVPVIGSLRTPRLESVSLNDIGFLTGAIPGPLCFLQLLQLTGQEPFGLPSHSDCLDFIALCPDLRSCKLSLSGDPGRSHLSPVILRSLRHLHLIFQFNAHDPIPFLKALRTPHIECLTLQNHGGISPVQHIRRVLDVLLSGRPQTIKELHVSSLFVRTSDWVPSLRELTELRTLSIKGDSLDEMFFAALISKDPSTPCPCPQLKSLELHHVTCLVGIAGDQLVEFIRSRTVYTTGGSTPLESLTIRLCNMEERHEDELREIENQSDLRVYGLDLYDARTARVLLEGWKTQGEWMFDIN